MPGWLQGNESLLGGLALASIVTFVGSLVAVPWLVVRIPADYFAHRHPHRLPWAGRHPALRTLLVVLKNLAGGAFVLAGIAMLVLPGQGLLTIVVGILLLDFPGKHAVERRIVGQPVVLRSINWLRANKGRPPLVVD